MFSKLKSAVSVRPDGDYVLPDLLRYRCYRMFFGEKPARAKAAALAYLLENYPAKVYEHDLVAGSRMGCFVPAADYDRIEAIRARDIAGSYGSRHFTTNADHFAPGYDRFLADGISGTLDRIHESIAIHADDSEKTAYLGTMRDVLAAFAVFVKNHAIAAREAAGQTSDETCRANLTALAADLDHIAWDAPVTLRQALNLTWLVHLTFLLMGKYAMALGRMDQYLYPYYLHDKQAGTLTDREAEILFASTFIKIGESRWLGGDDVVNIAIGGVKPDGSEGINELSYIILHAVRDCNIPGPNLSARLHEGMPDEFLDECLQVIGTGLGYPALMNDRVNIPALTRHGYTLEDARNYCFVGCIENFIPGKQPAWSDGRFNVPEYLEAVFFRGKSLIDEHYLGVDTGDVAKFKTMDDFMRAFERQLDFAAAEYVTIFANENDRYNRKNYTDPFMSLFCDDCIARGMDINDGGAHYPSAHGAGCMGIGTVADSLAAIEKCVFNEQLFTLTELRDAMAADFKGYETLQAHLINAPKYGNDDDFVDKYAVWYVDYLDKIFSKYRTPDGGPYYTAIASNTASVYAGMGIGATPDGRHAKVPLSDAASPTYGMDQSGTTAVFLSLSKPDYKLVSCGTVLNQKYTEDMLQKPENRAALLAALKVYFARGGQEVQINCVSKETLRDAMEHPEKYAGLVVRVSGFSAYFTKLDRAVQEDILHRTEHSEMANG
ncbi:MAG: hypothetical protein J6C42_12320 [Clostridia bacterium]|nr:hypothetical protein [Clostridia bacterium]